MKKFMIDGDEWSEEEARKYIVNNVRVTDDGHWIYMAAAGPYRHGTVTISTDDGRRYQYYARRFSYAAANGHIRKGQQVSVTCGVDRCVCPDHIQLAPLTDAMDEYQMISDRLLGAGA